MAQHILISGDDVTGRTTARVFIKSGYQGPLPECRRQPLLATCFAKGGRLRYRYAAPCAERDIALKGLKMPGQREENIHHSRSCKSVIPRLNCHSNKMAISINPKNLQAFYLRKKLNLSTDGNVLHSGQRSDRAIAAETCQSSISADEYSVVTGDVCLLLLTNRGVRVPLLHYRITA